MFLLLHHFDPFYVHKIRFHKYVKFRIKYVVWAAKPKWPYACEQKASWFSVFGSLIRFAFFGNGVFFCNEWNSKQSKVKQSIGLNGPKSRMKSDEETHGSWQKKKSRKKTEHDKHNWITFTVLWACLHTECCHRIQATRTFSFFWTHIFKAAVNIAVYAVHAFFLLLYAIR